MFKVRLSARVRIHAYMINIDSIFIGTDTILDTHSLQKIEYRYII